MGFHVIRMTNDTITTKTKTRDPNTVVMQGYGWGKMMRYEGYSPQSVSFNNASWFRKAIPSKNVSPLLRHSYSNILNSKVGVKKLRRDGSFMSLISWLSNTNIFGFYCCCGVDLAFNPKHWYVLTCEKHQKHSLCRFV